MRFRLTFLITLIALLSASVAPPLSTSHAQDGPPDAGAWPLLGMNLYEPSYYDGVIYFNDATRHGSHWMSHNPASGEWDDGRAFPQDENGYPTDLAADQALRMIIYLDGEHLPRGTYTLTWAGQGELGIDLNGEVTRIGPQHSSPRSIEVPAGGMVNLFLIIYDTDPADHLRDIHLWLPGTDENSSTFTEHFKEWLAPFNPVRFMFWNHTIEPSAASAWEKRARRETYTWGANTDDDFSAGVPYEVMVELCNEMDKDCWITVPHLADEEFMTELARLVDAQLAPGLRVWIEFSNEHWNWDYPVNGWLYEGSLAVAEDAGQEEYYLFHHYGRLATRLIEIFKDTFQDDTRVVGVLAGLADWAAPLENAVQEAERQGRLELVDALAIGPYIANYNESEDGLAAIDVAMLDALPEVTDAEYAALFEMLHQQVDAMFQSGEYFEGMQANLALAERLGLPLVGYEAGQHLTAWGKPDELRGPYRALNARPEMYDLYLHFLDGWQAMGGETLVLFHLAGFWSDEETFGHIMHYGQDLATAHKYRALLDWLATQGAN